MTYQGQLMEAGQPYTGSADFRFTLFDGSTSPTQIGPTVTFSDVFVLDGLFAVKPDFGTDVFTGEKRWLQVEVRTPHDPSDTLPYTILDPRQELTPTPYAVHATTAGAVTNGITGNGSANCIARFTGPTSIQDSNICQDSDGNVGIGGEPFDGGMGSPALSVNTGDEYASVWIGGSRDTNGEEVGGIAFVGGGSGSFTNSYASIEGQIIDSSTQPVQGALIFKTGSGTVPISEEKIRIMPDGDVGIGTDDPRSKLHVEGGSIVHWSGGSVVGFGNTSVYTDEGTLDTDGDFVVSIPESFYKPWAYDNYIFKVEVFVSLAYYEPPPCSNRGSAYSMALVGKQRGTPELFHFKEVAELKTEFDATVNFNYSSPTVGLLRIAVDTNRQEGVDYKVVVKISH
jgi:hypothetical protein